MRYFIASLFILIGLLNPTVNPFDIAIVLFNLSFVSYVIFQQKYRNSGPIVISTIAIILHSQLKIFSPYLLFGAFTGLLIGFVLTKYQRLRKFTVLILISSFLLTSILNSSELRNFLSSDLSLFAYNNDPGVFLKSYHLIGQNGNYYESFKTAMQQRFIQSGYPEDIWGWRLPTIYILWNLLPGSNGIPIYIFYLFLASSVLLVGYFLGKKFSGDNFSILPSYLIFPYLHYAARDEMFLITEWWSISFYIIAIYFLIYKKLFFTTIFLSICLMIREIYIIPTVFMLLYSLIFNKKLIPIFLIAISAFALIFLYHLVSVNNYINAYGTLTSLRINPNGPLFIHQTLVFASWEYLLNQIKPFAILFMLALIGCLKLYKSKFKNEAVILLMSFLPFPLFFLKIGTLPYNDYWGIIYVPMAILLSPLVLLNEKRKI